MTRQPKEKCKYGHARIQREGGIWKCPPCLRVGNLMRRTGMTREEINEILEDQPEYCEICGAKGPVYFDHNHATGKFRGWLCHWCNVGIGAFKDDPELMKAAIKFIKRSKRIG